MRSRILTAFLVASSLAPAWFSRAPRRAQDQHGGGRGRRDRRQRRGPTRPQPSGLEMVPRIEGERETRARRGAHRQTRATRCGTCPSSTWAAPGTGPRSGPTTRRSPTRTGSTRATRCASSPRARRCPRAWRRASGPAGTAGGRGRDPGRHGAGARQRRGTRRPCPATSLQAQRRRAR